MHKDEAIELLLRGKKVRLKGWSKGVHMVVKDGKLTHSVSNDLFGSTVNWQKDGWEEYVETLNKYQAVDILFEGGKVYRGRTVSLSNAWGSDFKDWYEDGYVRA